MTTHATPMHVAADIDHDLGHRRPNLAEAAVWGACLAIAIAGHLVFFIELSHRPKTSGDAPRPAAVMIDLSPLPAPPIAAPQPTPSPKVPIKPQPVTPPPPSIQQMPRQPSVAAPPVSAPAVPADMPVAAADASLPLPPQPPPAPPRPPRKAPRILHQRAPLPPVAATAEARTAGPPAPAPAPSLQSASLGSTAEDWQSKVLAHIARFKNYPTDAQDNGWQGTSVLCFTLTRSGIVTTVEIVKSSGHADLDAAAMATVRRASPLPPPPETVPGEPITLTLPLQFSFNLD